MNDFLNPQGTQIPAKRGRPVKQKPPAITPSLSKEEFLIKPKSSKRKPWQKYGKAGKKK